MGDARKSLKENQKVQNTKDQGLSKKLGTRKILLLERNRAFLYFFKSSKSLLILGVANLCNRFRNLLEKNSHHVLKRSGSF